ncbi:phage NrS-1 polymerase family protein [Halobaculum limi]|uniref:phage NrS-1 polymerase family protein n=1 Tax=Halobaculum limi TaxID=3031916 RepID=UPI0024063A64|nr:hypothetical protein [Halobaculum sp. YSMS11]
MNPNALPIGLREYPQWVCWISQDRDGRTTKVPFDPSKGSFASTASPETWGTFDAALSRAARSDVDGIGFVFTEDDPFVGVDLDDCRKPKTGVLTDDAVRIVTRLQSYTEVSPSGTGVHIIARGRLPDGARRRGSVEMYDDARFFTMTGERLPGTPSRACVRPGALQVIHSEYVDVSHSSGTTYYRTSNSGDIRASWDDVEIIDRAKAAANGEKFTALWNGSTAGYESHSEADMALCCLLAFWTDGEPSKVDRLFRKSGLVRSKWDDVHYSDGATYGERTIERACKLVSDSPAGATD